MFLLKEIRGKEIQKMNLGYYVEILIQEIVGIYWSEVIILGINIKYFLKNIMNIYIYLSIFLIGSLLV